MDRKAVSMWKVTKNLILTDVCVIALFWLIRRDRCSTAAHLAR